jgi:hypothetical protein
VSFGRACLIDLAQTRYAKKHKTKKNLGARCPEMEGLGEKVLSGGPGLSIEKKLYNILKIIGRTSIFLT